MISRRFRRSLLFGVSALLVVGAASASATTVRERTIASGTGYRFEGFTASYGYVAWLESAPEGKPDQRVVLRDGGATRRSQWFSGRSHVVAIRRRVDERTGHVVVRVAVSRLRAGVVVDPVLLSPVTLRKTSTEWPAGDPNVARAYDGTTTATATVVPGPVTGVYGPSQWSQCQVTVSSSTSAIPSLPDCDAVPAVPAPGILVRDTRVLVFSTVPSKLVVAEKGSVQVDAVHYFSLDRPEQGWVELGEDTDVYAHDSGLQGLCVLKDGFAVLNGVTPDETEDEPAPAPWTLSFVPTAPGARAWSATVPGITLNDSEIAGPTIACTNGQIYARVYVPSRREPSEVATTRIVTLTPRA